MANAHATDRYKTNNRFTVYADVISAEPLYREVVVKEPREECWTEEQRHMIKEGSSGRHNNHSGRHRSGADALVGGVIGGVIGNQLGRNGSSRERAGATVAGAIIGSVIGNESRGSNSHRRHRRHRNNTRHNYSNHNSAPVYEVRPVNKCRTVIENRYEQRIDGYNVTYEHRGRRFQTRTRKDPGRQIELRVLVEPVTVR